MKAGVIVLAHGSRGERGASEVPEVLQRLADGLRQFLSPKIEIVGAALQFNRPSLEEAAELLIAQGLGLIIIAPYFLFPGRHLTEHIPRVISELKSIHPGAQFVLADNLGLQEYFVELIARRITDACPDLLPNTPFSFSSPEVIEKQSMDMIESMLPQGLVGEERTVTKRVIHASGDPSIAHLIKFSTSAISSGISAIAGGNPIYTDVTMVAAGINRHLAEACGSSLICALDEINSEQMTRASTRTASAMYGLRTRLNNSIVAIGNAPTALLALVDMIDRENVVPALVVGMPVGFVMARESKAELMKRNIPYITIMGTRGGSALAVATINALLRLAKN